MLLTKRHPYIVLARSFGVNSVMNEAKPTGGRDIISKVIGQR